MAINNPDADLKRINERIKEMYSETHTKMADASSLTGLDQYNAEEQGYSVQELHTFGIPLERGLHDSRPHPLHDMNYDDDGGNAVLAAVRFN